MTLHRELKVNLGKWHRLSASVRKQGLVRENIGKVEEGGAGADWGWREGGDGDSAAFPNGLQEEEKDEEAHAHSALHRVISDVQSLN